MSIYQDIILDHYRNPRNFGKMNHADKTTKLSNPLCGDEIELSVVFNNKKITQVEFIAKGCAISMASASMLTEYVKNKNNDSLRKLDKDFMIKLLGINLSPNRLRCALLPLEALTQIISF